MKQNQPIGVFDSGVGGLTVLAALAKALPNENFVYLGDTARVPYGVRSARIVRRYSMEDVHFLLKYKIKMLVIACNTATAYAESNIKDLYQDLPALGVIQPGIDALFSRIQIKRVGIVGTHSTIKSEEYRNRILAKDSTIQVFSQACPLFVPLVEEGWLDTEITRLVVCEYFSRLIQENVDSVVLGCTHYPLLKETIQKEYPSLQLIDSSEETAKAAKQLLIQKNLLADSSEKQQKISLYLTDITEQDNIQSLDKFLFGVRFSSLEEVQLPLGSP